MQIDPQGCCAALISAIGPSLTVSWLLATAGPGYKTSPWAPGDSDSHTPWRERPAVEEMSQPWPLPALLLLLLSCPWASASKPGRHRSGCCSGL